MILLMITSVQAYGITLLFIGVVIRLFTAKRTFDRNGVGGMQHFRNYWMSLLLPFLEWLANIAACLMIIAGLLLLLVEWYNTAQLN